MMGKHERFLLTPVPARLPQPGGPPKCLMGNHRPREFLRDTCPSRQEPQVPTPHWECGRHNGGRDCFQMYWILTAIAPRGDQTGLPC